MADRRDYGIRKTVHLPYGETVKWTREALQEQGFGVLSEIGMTQKLKEKLGIDTGDYVIPGPAIRRWHGRRCRPSRRSDSSFRATSSFTTPETATPSSRAVDPDSMLSIVGGNPAVAEVAHDARQRLEAALQSIG